MNTWRLGLGGSDHDFSAALMHKNDIRIAIEQERLTRRKHSPTFWYEDPVALSIDYCLAAEGISMTDIDIVVGCDTLPARVRRQFSAIKSKFYSHHLCHAASAYLMLSPGKIAGVFVFDGYGSIVNSETNDPHLNRRETFSFYKFSPEGYEVLGITSGLGHIEQDDFEIGVNHSIGMLYELITGLIGFDPMNSGKTMGIASYGTEAYVPLIEEFVEYGEDMSQCVRISSDAVAIWNILESELAKRSDIFVAKADMAASLQAVLNKILVHCAKLFQSFEIDAFCISGGCALNSVANSYLVRNSPLSVPISIPPHCNDAGLAFGALWLESQQSIGKSPELTFRTLSAEPTLARPGRCYTRKECRDASMQFYPHLVLDASVKTASDLAQTIADGSIVALFNGGSEIGPRALGSRSILADPRGVEVRERINRKIKKREPFRPLAPIVRYSDFEEYFQDQRCADPYMLKVAQVTDHCRRSAPAIVHVDGSARAQIVAEDTQPFLDELLLEFKKMTGVGILINTSFNRNEEPIVETPEDAFDSFIGLGIDGIFIEGDFYRLSTTSLANV